MNNIHLSLEANGILTKAKRISGFLKIDIERLVGESGCESEFLTKVYDLVGGIVQDQDQYLEDWLLEKRFDERRLRELFQYIDAVRYIPPTVKIYDSSYKKVISMQAA
ncbi:MAG: hypothetical protein ACI8ZB_002909 [Desulforhopalus sp.]|jgi:hypothetical protein